MFFEKVLCVEPPENFFVTEPFGDRTLCHDVAHIWRMEPCPSTAAFGCAALNGTALAMLRAISAMTWLEFQILLRNIMHRPRKRAHEGDVRRCGAKIFFDKAYSERVGFCSERRCHPWQRNERPRRRRPRRRKEPRRPPGDKFDMHALTSRRRRP